MRLLGHGGSASVFEGVHVELGKPVAIKLLHDHLADDSRIRNRFVREGRVAARLRHPNVVEALDVGLFESVPYLVMELLVGEDLRARLAKTSLLSVEEALAVLLPIASGLVEAHRAGVVHRDIKPANVFLAQGARGEVVPKLVDFGLSMAHLGQGTSSLTEMDGVAGTALYMSPEQTLGAKHATAASDQYSLAAVLYEALAGRPPFLHDAVLAVLERIRSESPPPPGAHNPAVPRELDAVVLRAMSRDARARFADVVAFGAALLPFADAPTRAAFDRDFAPAARAPAPGRRAEP
ncbi:MAG TPA: serine/threonine-protein kinase, partial [Polyangiaceae bacterium]